MSKKVINNKNSIFYLVLCSALFSFYANIQDQKYSIKSWCFTLVVNTIISLFIIIVIKSTNEYSLILRVIVAAYLIFSLSKQTVSLLTFLNVFYNENSIISTVIISACVLLFYCFSKDENVFKMSKFLFPMAVILIAILLLSNISKFEPINLYDNILEYKYINIAYLDWIIPFCILKNKREGAKSILTIYGLFLIVTILAFSLTCGDIIYNVNPFQILFLISTGNIVRNYDGICIFLLYFMYVSMLLINMLAYSKMKFNKKYLLISLPLIFLANGIFNSYFFGFQIIILTLLFINGVISNEKN